MQVCNGEPVDATPVWFMRQAGRSFAEYRRLRERYSILEMCRTPELAAEVTMQPVRRLGVDAAILFSDIVVPLSALGVDVDIVEGLGPVIASPIRSERDLDGLVSFEGAESVPHVVEAVRSLVEELDVPLIGFAGAPFTLASYLIEGRPSKDHARAKSLMYREPSLWQRLMDLLTDTTVLYLRAQIDAGAAAVQLFDSWAGWLEPGDYRVHVLPWVKRIFAGLDGLGAPLIYFGVATGELLGMIGETGADVIGVDWRVPLDVARKRLPSEMVLQGNLDPAALLAPPQLLEEKVFDVLERGGGSGHIFNLGHGVLPMTDPDDLARVVDLVHGWDPSAPQAR